MKNKLLTLLFALMATTAIKAEVLQVNTSTPYAIPSENPCITASGTCGENLTWEVSCEGVLTIRGTGAMDNFSYNNAPWQTHAFYNSVVIENGVTNIGEWAFYYSIELTNVIIPNSVTTIGEGAFQYCSKLSSITIPSSVTTIDHAAFTYSGLTSVTIPSSVTSLGLYVFAGCNSLTSIDVESTNPNYCSDNGILFNKDKTTIVQYPAGKASTTYSIPTFVHTIGIGAFQGCNKLTTVMIPTNVSTIENDAFYGSNGLTSIAIPNSITSIGRAILSDCDNLLSIDVATDNPNYCSADGVLFNKDQTILLACPGAKQGEYTIPNSVTSIKEYAFSGCKKLTYITIPSSTVNIESLAFQSCFAPLDITNYAIVPQTIEESVFNGVYLPNCTLYVPAQSLAAYQAADVWKDFGTIIAFGEEVEPQYITIADTYNMAQDSAFTLGAFDVVFVDGAYCYIKDSTGYAMIYKNNYGLQAGNHVEAGMEGKINIYYGLYEITPLTAVVDLIITAGEVAAPMEATEAPSANNVNQYVVYKNVSFDTDTAFIEELRKTVYGSWNGQQIRFYNQFKIGATLQANKTYNITAFNGIYNTTIRVYPIAVEEVSGETPCLIASGTCGENLTWELSCDSVLTISGTGAMEEYIKTDNETYLELDTTAVPWYDYHDAITSVVIEDGVTSIGVLAFYKCTGLTSVTIGNSVTDIGSYAFIACAALKSVNIGNSVTSISYSTFAYCTALESVNIPNSVTEIGSNAFKNCRSLSSVIIPNSVAFISTYAFDGCTGLTSVEIPNSVTNIREGTFQDCISLTSINIPNSVTSIGNWAFINCRSLTSIEIPSSVTSIGHQTFAYCSSMTSINVAEDNQQYCSVDGVLFNKDQTTLLQYPSGKTLSSYAIPNTVTSIEVSAFGLCTSMSSVIIPNSVTSIEDLAFSSCSGLTSVTNYATTPQTIHADVFGYVDLSNCTLYVPAQSLAAYQAADVWKDFGTILPIEEDEPIETIEADYNFVYIGYTDDELSRELVTLHVPVAPIIEGFNFLKWQVVAGDLEDGIVIEAVYTANPSSAAPEIYTDPANPAQKLIRNGNVYILKGDKVYTIQGQKVK